MTTPRQTLPITVVIPAFNRPQAVVDAIRSVQAQALYAVTEILVVDDASSDDTADRAAAAGASVIRLPENGGAAKARNVGIRAASTEWIALLDSDDVWMPDLLKTLWPERADHTIVGGSAIAIDGEGHHGFLGNASASAIVLSSPAGLYPVNPVSASGTMFQTEAARALGGFATHLRFSEDLDLWIRLLEVGTCVVIPQPVVEYRQHAGQKSRDPRIREAQAAITAQYVDRAWCTPRLAEQQLAFHAWDAFRADLRLRKYRSAAKEFGWFLRRPVSRTRALSALLRERAARRRAATLRASDTLL